MIFKNVSFILRRFSRQKLTTTLHVVGLCLGITVCLLIGLFIKYELSFDAYHAKAGRTYRINQVWIDAGKKTFHYSTPFPLADEIRKDIPGLENVTRIHHPFQAVVEINPTKRFKQDHVMMTDPEFLDVFDVQVVEGNGHEALRKPYQAILTESTAKKFFGNEDALGKIFRFNDEFNITVAAVIKDFPGNTHLPASMLLSLSNEEKYIQTSPTEYGSVSGGSTFIVLPEGMKPNSGLQASLQSIYDRLVNKQSWMPKDSRVEMEIQPLSDVHFNSKYAGGGEWVQAVNVQWLWFFGAVGVAVLILACINFVNLSTAQALTRAKEVGVRKSIGAGRVQLITQFLGEAVLLVLFSGLIGVIITKLSLPSLNLLTGKKITFDLFHSIPLLLTLLGGLLFTSLLAGIYPAWIITKFQPAATLKSGSVGTNPHSVILRKSLVVAQFCISLFLLIGLLFIGRQMEFMRHRDLGFNKDNVVIVNLPDGNSVDKETLLAQSIQQLPEIKTWSFSTSPPSGDKNTHWGTVMSVIGKEDPNRQQVTTIMTDDRYCQMYGFKLLAGRFPVAADTNAVSQSVPEGQRFAKSVVNAKLVQALGFASPQAALGKRFWIGMNGWTAEVTGVVADFNIGSLHEAIKPTLITQFLPFADKANIAIKSGSDVPATISKIGRIFQEIYPKGIFEYNFLDDQLSALYKSEERLFDLFKIFSGLAMLISCLGLWGLITYAAQQRTKEIGIRKVLGASVPGIVTLLTKDFLVLVAIAIAIVVPVAYWSVNLWLHGYAFRIPVSWEVFVIAGLAALGITILTISFQAIRAAISNPVKSLRTE